MNRDRLHAPENDGAVLCEPDRSLWPALAQANAARLSGIDSPIGGLPFAEWRRLIRNEAAECIAADARNLGESTQPPLSSDAVWIASGHQPEPFHPGVWIKNFAAAGLAREIGGQSLHIRTDNDACRKAWVFAPSGDPQDPLVAVQPFDEWNGEAPYEERTILDESQFASFGGRVVEAMADYGFRPSVAEVWPHAIACKDKALGDRLAAGRRSLERQWNAASPETTLGRLCETRGFRLFMADVLLRAAEFAAIHNAELDLYRRRYHVRSRHHPVPSLERDGDWIEAPIWAWSTRDAARVRPFVRMRGTEVSLRIPSAPEMRVDIARGDRTALLADKLAEWTSPVDGVRWKLRPRALLTTAFLRLGVSDLFIHGIGGGKYDELTDSLIRRFWKIDPPAYVVATATLHLPNARGAKPARPPAAVARARRDLEWNPDRHLDDLLRERAPIDAWIERKHDLMAHPAAGKAERRDRWKEFRQLNERLRPFVDAEAASLEREERQATSSADRYSLLAARDFAYFLHPVESLQRLMLPLLETG